MGKSLKHGIGVIDNIKICIKKEQMNNDAGTGDRPHKGTT
jgi:hypothetical protein